ncbi:MAG: capsular polysaccharide synthesis protein [Bacteroidaceae bacterium]|nr:capsular polysaccharide synthesis protein [Bacteroidaceae bacterium]
MRIVRLTYLCRKSFERAAIVIKNFWIRRKHYSWKYATYDLLEWIGFYSRSSRLQLIGIKKKQLWLDGYIEQNYGSIIERFRNLRESGTIAKDFNIWVFWAQGEENMPPIVKACYRQLCANNKGVVKLLDLKNVGQYVSLPGFVFEKLREGKLLYAHFSDILRHSLIAKYGGFWIDATCWTGGAFPEELRQGAFISPHNEEDGTYWCSYALGSGLTGSVTFSFVKAMLIAVCEKEEVWPDYLFQDRLLDYAHRKVGASREAINATPANNTRRFLLYPMLNKPFDEAFYNDLTSTDWLFKLSYKSNFNTEQNGKETFYGKMIKGTINVRHKG